MAVLGSERWQVLSGYLDHALDLTEVERAAWLLTLDVEEPTIAPDVRVLLEEHAVLNREHFLEDAFLAPAPPLAGQMLGAYTLVSLVGQGGMGTVWLAERADGRFTGSAAVKLLNMALVGRSVEERFRREGSILARLRHPNIAHLIDAGVSPTGQPYLVLEYVEGEHIDRYCASRHLDLEARVRLFLDVLSAVVHAHASLIVHRDLKPSNVLVRNDGTVKLLDFGIAKLLETDTLAADATLTIDAGRALTPEYAAPEQLTGAPITTAADVYSLGVLLYVMLGGQHPAGKALNTPAELLRSTLEVVPPRLSTIVGRHVVSDDLDVILAKALKKDPGERYISATAFADDLRRYLDRKPIAARPDSLTYRATKFLQRHRRGVMGVAVAILALSALIAFYTFRLAAERDRARLEADKAAKVSELLTGILTSADPYGTRDKQEPTVRELLDAGAVRVQQELAAQPELQVEMLTVIGRVYERLEASDKAQPLLEKALAIGRSTLGPEHVRIAQTLNDLGALLRDNREFAKSGPMLEEAVAMRRRLLGPNDKDLAISLVEYARHLWDSGTPARAEPIFREALAVRRRVFGENHRETATSMNELGLLLWETGDLAEAEPLIRQGLAINRRVLRADHPNVGASVNNLALVVEERGQYAEAESLYRESLVVDRKTWGQNSINTAETLNNLSHPLRHQGKFAEAEAVLNEAIGIARGIGGNEQPTIGMLATNLGRVHLASGRLAEAEASLRHGLKVRLQNLPADDWKVGVTKSLLGATLTQLGRLDEAETLLLDAVAALKRTGGVQGREGEEARQRLAALYEERSRRARQPSR